MTRMHPGSLLTLLLASLLLISPAALAEFGPESDAGWPVNVEGEEIRPPVEAHHEHDHRLDAEAPGPANKVGPFTLYPYYPLLTAEVQRLATDHPDLVKLSSGGTSRAGLGLWLLEIADFHNIEAGDAVPLEQREVVYLDGGTHSNEYSGVYFVTEVAQFLLDEYETNETAQWIVENRHTFILPMVNPDGSNAFGRMNAAWVNVNRNFPAIWNEVDEDFLFNNPGPEPASEPETQVVLDVLESIQPDYVNSIHCCGNLWLHPYGHEDFQAEEDDLEMFTRICDEVFADVREDCGPIWSTIYPASGTTADTGYDLHGASSWTYEMSGRGAVAPWGQPTIVDDVRVQERESWRGVIHAMLHTEKYGAHPVVTAVEGTTDTLTVEILNDGYQPLRAGTLTLDGIEVQLPTLGPSNATTLELPGSFEAGAAPLELSWQKRVKHAPWGERTVGLVLEAQGDALVGVLSETPGEVIASSDADQDPPAEAVLPWLLPLVALAGGAGLVARRNRSAFRRK